MSYTLAKHDWRDDVVLQEGAGVRWGGGGMVGGGMGSHVV